MLRYDDAQQERITFYQMIILVTLMIAAGRIAAVISREGDTAFLSANDRSRWCTVASLVEEGTYAIDRQLAIRDAKGHRPWYTIDLVRHHGADGKLHYYSSKPPLYSTLVAGVYAVVHWTTGMRMTDQPIYVPRVILALVNLPLLGIFCWYTIAIIERMGVGDWPRRVGAVATCFATMLLPFSITLNNHLPAAAAAAVVMNIYLYAAQQIRDEFNGWTHTLSRSTWTLAGLAAGFMAANELPALSMLACWFALIAWLDWRSLGWFTLGVVIIAAAFFGTNHLAHDSFRPPYAHRGLGAEIATLDQTGEALPSDAELRGALVETGQLDPQASITVTAAGESGRWVVQTEDERLFAVTRETIRRETPSEAASELTRDPLVSMWKIHHWDDWYDYPASYWRGDRRRGVDLGEPSRLAYAFHLTLGHHGIFSLTPFWLLIPIGVAFSLAYAPRDFRWFALAVTAATLVCFAFYVMRPLIDRNYGGVSCCFRWMLWFTPMWMVLCMPALNEWGESPRARWGVLLLLAISVFSVSTALQTPWQSPWLYRFWAFLGWIGT